MWYRNILIKLKLILSEHRVSNIWTSSLKDCCCHGSKVTILILSQIQCLMFSKIGEKTFFITVNVHFMLRNSSSLGFEDIFIVCCSFKNLSPAEGYVRQEEDT